MKGHNRQVGNARGLAIGALTGTKASARGVHRSRLEPQEQNLGRNPEQSVCPFDLRFAAVDVGGKSVASMLNHPRKATDESPLK